MTGLSLEKKSATAVRPSKLESSLLGLVRDGTNAQQTTFRSIKENALARLMEHGLPSRNDEAYRFSGIGTLGEREVSVRGGIAPLGTVSTASVESRSILLQIVNGEAVAAEDLPTGLRILRLRDALATNDTGVLQRVGTLLCAEDGFIAANTAGFTDGYAIVVEDGAAIDTPVELRVGHGSRVPAGGTATAACFPRVLVCLGRGSKLSLIERHDVAGEGPSLSLGIGEIFVGDGAELEHARWVDLGGEQAQIAATEVTVGVGAMYRSWSVTAAGGFVRHDLRVRLAGRRACAVLDGLYYGRKEQLADHHVQVWHEQPEGSTKECYRGVVEDLGKGVFDGIIYVRSGAMKTDARQENRNLLLGPQAVVNTKPHLEIDADDVACSHGATVGQLDENQLFYLQARGIERELGRQMLTWAFAKEIVERCPFAGLRRVAVDRLRGALPDLLEHLDEGAQS
ncbi:MAG: Fe-S cluster assembly protein SufD [Polyangiaceae bacterium]